MLLNCDEIKKMLLSCCLFVVCIFVFQSTTTPIGSCTKVVQISRTFQQGCTNKYIFNKVFVVVVVIFVFVVVVSVEIVAVDVIADVVGSDEVVDKNNNLISKTCQQSCCFACCHFR